MKQSLTIRSACYFDCVMCFDESPVVPIISGSNRGPTILNAKTGGRKPSLHFS
ncbi:MAG: hypothetical protein J5964_02505 [Eubacterium sp.]|nr:hypothetical protein [Eubacterium sp.]